MYLEVLRERKVAGRVDPPCDQGGCGPTLKLKNIYITRCIYIYIYIKYIYGFYRVPTLNFVRKTKNLGI